MADKLIYLIAGEASGDLLGAGLMASMKRQDPDIQFAGIGGDHMIAEGLQPLFPMADLSVMGLAEVVAHLPRLLRRIKETVSDVLAKKPAVVVGIDAPDFCFRVEKKIRAADPGIKLVHYVAPSVWAWRPGRAKKIAAFLDHLLALLPFEPPYFTAVGLPCTFVGHPAVSDSKNLSSSAKAEDPSGRHTADWGLNSDRFPAFAGNDALGKDAQIILLLPGSRRSEVTRLLPLFLDVAKTIAKGRPNLFFAFPTVSNVAQILREGLAEFDLPHAIIEGKMDKENAFATAHAALAASGTVALELALAGVPAVISYRFAKLTGMIAHRVIRVKYASLPNLIFNREIMPEFIQENAETHLIAPALLGLLDDSETRRMQLAATRDLPEILKPNDVDPSVKAAEVVLSLLNQ